MKTFNKNVVVGTFVKLINSANLEKVVFVSNSKRSLKIEGREILVTPEDIKSFYNVSDDSVYSVENGKKVYLGDLHELSINDFVTNVNFEIASRN